MINFKFHQDTEKNPTQIANADVFLTVGNNLQCFYGNEEKTAIVEEIMDNKIFKHV